VIINKSFSDLLKKYQAWVIEESMLDTVDQLTIKVEEENGTIYSDSYSFTTNRDSISNIITNGKTKKVKDEKGISKYILPLSLFNVETNNETERKKIQQLGPEWYFKLRGEFHKPYMKKLSFFLKEERSKHVIYPASPDVFRALRITPFSEVNVIAIGQNPYHNGLADGLAFSSLNELVIPKSLQNIFKEIENDVYDGFMLDTNPKLDRWAKQGVLLINTSLTVREGEAESHFNEGWEIFTAEIISRLYEVNRPMIWMLWGKEAQSSFDSVIAKYGKINEAHLVLRAAHPSPLSASRGFFGCRHFSKCNKFLEANGLRGIEW
jgi:uracil-DNA glycosylase